MPAQPSSLLYLPPTPNRALGEVPPALRLASHISQHEAPSAALHVRMTAACRLGCAGRQLVYACGGSLADQHDHLVTRALAELVLRCGPKQLAAIQHGPELAGGGALSLDLAASVLEAQMAAVPLLLVDGQPPPCDQHGPQADASDLPVWLFAAVATLQHLQAAAAGATGAVKGAALSHA